MRHQRQLVRGVKPHQVTDRPPVASVEQLPQPLMREHPLDEVLAQLRIAQAAFFFDRQVRQPGHQRRGEHAAPAALGGPPVSA